MKRYSVVFHLDHYYGKEKDFDDLQEARTYWRENNGGKHHNGGVLDNSLASKYRWV